jgi:hypothetical protein
MNRNVPGGAGGTGIRPEGIGIVGLKIYAEEGQWTIGAINAHQEKVGKTGGQGQTRSSDGRSRDVAAI